MQCIIRRTVKGHPFKGRPLTPGFNPVKAKKKKKVEKYFIKLLKHGLTNQRNITAKATDILKKNPIQKKHCS